MKRNLAVLLALAMLVSCVALFASCGAKPQLDLEKAKDALEDEDYTVYYSDEDDSEDIPFIEETLSAYDEDDNRISIIRFADAKSAKLYYKQLKVEHDAEIDQIKAEIKELEAEIKFYEHILKKYDDELKSDEADESEENIEELEDEIKDLEKELEDMKDDYVIGRSGKVVWYGTKDAIKASKG